MDERAESIHNLWSERCELVRRKIWSVDEPDHIRRQRIRTALEDQILSIDAALRRMGCKGFG